MATTAQGTRGRKGRNNARLAWGLFALTILFLACGAGIDSPRWAATRSEPGCIGVWQLLVNGFVGCSTAARQRRGLALLSYRPLEYGYLLPRSVRLVRINSKVGQPSGT